MWEVVWSTCLFSCVIALRFSLNALLAPLGPIQSHHPSCCWRRYVLHITYTPSQSKDAPLLICILSQICVWEWGTVLCLDTQEKCFPSLNWKWNKIGQIFWKAVFKEEKTLSFNMLVLNLFCVPQATISQRGLQAVYISKVLASRCGLGPWLLCTESFHHPAVKCVQQTAGSLVLCHEMSHFSEYHSGDIQWGIGNLMSL